MDLNFVANYLCPVYIVQVALVSHAVLLGAGGIIGYVKAKSRPSFIAGVTSAILLFLCFVGSFVAPTTAELGAFVISDLLVAVFAIRMAKTKKFMPSGMLMVICLVASTYYLVAAITPWIVAKSQSQNPNQYQSNPKPAPHGGGAGNGGKLNLI